MTELASRGASFARGASKQDYATPPEFIEAVERRFGPIAFDLAAHAGNAKAAQWYGPGGVAEDALSEDWTKLEGNLWLNPEFANIAPWAAKCAESRGFRWDTRRIFLLTPASVGAVWFSEYVHGHALVLGLVGRLCFDGKSPYPKDCILSVFGEAPGFDVWVWRKSSIDDTPAESTIADTGGGR